MKISKDSSSKYDQDNKERLQNKLVKNIKVFLKKKKKKAIIRDDIKIFQRMKNESWLSIKKNNIE